MGSNLLDRAIGYVAPAAALRRQLARQTLAMSGAFTGARYDRAQTKTWFAMDGSADRLALPDLPTLRARSRDLVRNAPLACGAINTVVTNAIGNGLTLQARLDRELLGEVLGFDDAALNRWERDAERVWREWVGSENCDATRTQTFGEIQELAFRSALESGDVFVIRRMIARPGAALQTAVQVIEADQVGNPQGKPNSRGLAAGIELDALGAATAFWLYDRHPGGLGGVAGPAQHARRVPFYGARSGERQALHLFRRLRPGQSRGLPYLAPVIESLKQLDRYTEAEIQAAVISAAYTVLLKYEPSTDEMTNRQNGADHEARATHYRERRLQPGTFLEMFPGDDIDFASPQRPNQAFDPFVLAILRQIGVALELPFEILVKHFTASYSAARGALLEAWKFFRARRQWVAMELCQPVYGWVIAEAILRGRLSAPGFFDDPALRLAYLGAEWTGPAAGQIDPLKENKADEIAEVHGWKTAGEITAEKTGGDWERKAAQRGKEIKIAQAAGLVSTAAPALNGPDDEPEPDQDRPETQ